MKGTQYKATCTVSEASFLDVKLRIESAETEETLDLTSRALSEFGLQ